MTGVVGSGSGAPASPTRSRKRVIVAGAGIAGLSCAYELMKRGHEVIVLEASGRTGGHVRTVHDPLADGLYADTGAEHFYKPIYREYWHYLEEFKLPVVPYPRRNNMLRFIDGNRYTPEDLQTRRVLNGLGFNQRETDYLAQNPWWNLPLLYLQPYIGHFENERKPFGVGLDHLDQMSATELLKSDGASAAAIRFAGGAGSALDTIWMAAIKKLRGAPLLSQELFRIEGGNQRMTDAFAKRLGERIHLGASLISIRHGTSGVTVGYTEFGNNKQMEADYLVCCISTVMLRSIPVTPAWPEAKGYVLRHLPFYTEMRVVFQSRTAFWEKDGISPNIEFDTPELRACWRMADEVNTSRAVLIGTAAASSSAEQALATFRRQYPGKSEDVEQVITFNWATDPWAMFCERVTCVPGDLARLWPQAAEPCGRVHFAGAYAANINMGQEAAMESAMTAAEAIDNA